VPLITPIFGVFNAGALRRRAELLRTLALLGRREDFFRADSIPSGPRNLAVCWDTDTDLCKRTSLLSVPACRGLVPCRVAPAGSVSGTGEVASFSSASSFSGLRPTYKRAPSDLYVEGLRCSADWGRFRVRLRTADMGLPRAVFLSRDEDDGRDRRAEPGLLLLVDRGIKCAVPT
jgi:hypothetical protein